LTYAAPPDQRGQVIGLTESVQGLGRILGPVVAGELFQRVSPGAPMMLSALVSVLTVAISAGLWQIQAKPEKSNIPPQ
jgi:predicted MFS family arabinose efflux permease